MKSKTLYNTWLREMGATSRGMMFLGGSFATVDALKAADHDATGATATLTPGPQAARQQPAGATGGTRALSGATLGAALMVLPALAWVFGGNGDRQEPSGHVVDLPTLTVRPSAADAEAFRHSRRIVELEAVVVHPREEDRALFLAAR